MSQRSCLTRRVRSRPFLLFLFFLAIVLLASSQVRFSAAAEEAQPLPIVELPEEALTLPPHFANEVTAVPRIPAKLDRTLTQLSSEATRSPSAAADFALANELKLVNGRVQTRVLTAPDQQQSAAKVIGEAGGTVTYSSDLEPELQAWIPVASLEDVAGETAVTAVDRPAYLFPLDIDASGTTTEGLVPLGANKWQNAGERGAGVKIAIIDGAGLVGRSIAGAFATHWNCDVTATCTRSGLLAAAPYYGTIGGFVWRK